MPAFNGTLLKAVNDSALTSVLSVSAVGQHIVLTGSTYSTSRTIGFGKVLVGDLANLPTVGGIWTFAGPDAIVYGIHKKSGRLNIDGPGHRCQIIRCYISDITGTYPIWVGGGDDIVIARNEMFSWGVDSPCGGQKGISVRAPRPGLADGARRIRISYNYFHDQLGYNEESCTNDAEVISLGLTQSEGRARSEMQAWVHHNLIVNCLGDTEGLMVKASYNRIEFNHLNNVRGFNNRFGGFNQYIGNRVQNASEKK